MTEDPARYAGDESHFATSRSAPYLPPGIVHCKGVGYPDEDTGDIDWREGCEDCQRRLEPPPGKYTTHMEPPAIIAFWCPYRIPPKGAELAP